MPVTLAQAALNTTADIDFAVIDNLRRNSWLFNNMVWDDTVTPGTGGGTLTYGYTRLLASATPPSTTPGSTASTRPSSARPRSTCRSTRASRPATSTGPRRR
jgi:hypothetical protein